MPDPVDSSTPSFAEVVGEDRFDDALFGPGLPSTPYTDIVSLSVRFTVDTEIAVEGRVGIGVGS